jgi:hypothetical protein
LTLTHVAGGGDEEWSVQELHGLGLCKNGTILYRSTGILNSEYLREIVEVAESSLGLLYDNRFAWISSWNRDWKPVEMHAYFDCFLAKKAITENESG